MPDFQQFADRITCALKATTMESDGSLCLDLDLNETLLQAERHARLLQQIWEMVKDDVEWPEHLGPIHVNAAGGSVVGINACREAVRSLLVSQTDK